MDFARTTTYRGMKLARFATYQDIGAYYVVENPGDCGRTAYYFTSAGMSNAGAYEIVRDYIRAGKLRGVLDSDKITEATIGAPVVHASANSPTFAREFGGLL